MKHHWGATVICLGVWEAAAFATAGRVPTITRTVRGATRRWRYTRLLVAVWLLALGRHLVTDR